MYVTLSIYSLPDLYRRVLLVYRARLLSLSPSLLPPLVLFLRFLEIYLLADILICSESSLVSSRPIKKGTNKRYLGG